MLLHVNGQVVRSATGQNGEALQWSGWDVSSYIGQTAYLEIVDRSTGGWGHINVDEISFSNILAQTKQANWVDWGPDFYAALVWNGLPDYERVDIAWMNNWAYAGQIPTSPWRSAMTIPRNLTLRTINSKAAIVQQPVEGLQTLESVLPQYQQTWSSVPEGNTTLPVTGKALDITITFSTATASAPASTTTAPGSSCNRDNCLRAFIRDGSNTNPSFCNALNSASATTGTVAFPSYATACGTGIPQASRVSSVCSCLYPPSTATASSSSNSLSPTGVATRQFGIILRATEDHAQQTRVGYDFRFGRLFLDRTRSGDVYFNPAFAGVYYAPLTAGADGTVTMRILLDWSNVEVFGKMGETTITVQIFQADVGLGVALFSTEGATEGVAVSVRQVASTWV